MILIATTQPLPKKHTEHCFRSARTACYTIPTKVDTQFKKMMYLVHIWILSWIREDVKCCVDCVEELYDFHR